VPVLTSPGSRRLAVAGALIALLVFGVFFAVGRGGREPTRTTAVEAAPAAELDESAPKVGAVTGTSGSIPALKRRPEPEDTPATTGGPTTGTSGTSTTSPPPTTGTGTTSTTSPPTTSTTGPTSTGGPSTTGPPPTTGTGTTTTTN
jgi:hypothetical protein